jgi:hypothetical protein
LPLSVKNKLIKYWHLPAVYLTAKKHLKEAKIAPILFGLSSFSTFLLYLLIPACIRQGSKRFSHPPIYSTHFGTFLGLTNLLEFGKVVFSISERFSLSFCADVGRVALLVVSGKVLGETGK